MKNKLHHSIVRRIAQTCVGASALRNQGSPGIIEVCRNYFEKQWGNELGDFFRAIKSHEEYKNFLDLHTNLLSNKFPTPTDGGKKSWGGARKGLNLFFAEVVKDRYLCSDYIFDENDLKNLEVPLDKDVSDKLKEASPSITKWLGIRHLTEEMSEEYQKIALNEATVKEIHRYQLDLLYWRAGK